ncbi:MAG: hypothetical protein ACRDDX_14400 [Cellulosilyticaceae bacterium]
MKMFNNDLATQYDLVVKKMYYNRSNYYLDTNKGQYLLRKVIMPKEQIAFEYEVNKQLIQKGFNEIEKIYLTKKQSPYVQQQDKLYMLQSYRAMDEIDFKLEVDLRGMICVLARFHKAAQNITSSERNIENAGLKNIYEYFQKRHIETKKMKNNMSGISQKSKFEMMFAEHYKVYEELEQMAIELISKEIAEKLIDKAKKNHTVIHNEYTYHAVSKIAQKQYVITHLDACSYNIQLLDLANVLTKVMQKNDWNMQLLYDLVQEYTNINTLSEEEIKVLKAMLIFPEKFASICHKYMTSKRRNNYSMFEMKWENMLVYKEEQLRAAKQIEKIL